MSVFASHPLVDKTGILYMPYVYPLSSPFGTAQLICEPIGTNPENHTGEPATMPDERMMSRRLILQLRMWWDVLP